MARQFLLCATLLCLQYIAVLGQGGTPVRKLPPTRFTCQGRGSGYYADMDTGCQLYHMCDGLGRQFSYSCPNMTLFQQRMLICDHWYMVNCSMSEKAFDANLLIGQRDKPFVSDEEMQFRTPRPDVLAAPPYNPYYDILRGEETKFPHPGNSIAGVADTIDVDTNGLDNAKRNYKPSNSRSADRNTQKRKNNGDSKVGSSNKFNNVEVAASQQPKQIFQTTPTDRSTTPKPTNITPPSRLLSAPLAPATPTEVPTTEDDLLVTASENPQFNFIKRFDPNSPDYNTAMTKTEIIDLNGQLPAGSATSEEDRTPRKNKNSGNTFNDFLTDNDKNFPDRTRFDTVNTKARPDEAPKAESKNKIPEPEKVLLPPKTDFSSVPATTAGPQIYYEWKWAVPAINLQPPKESNATNLTSPQTRSVNNNIGTNPFRSVTRPPPTIPDLETRNTEYNVSSYFVPDYVFPLDGSHPGYESEEAKTSFQVHVPRPGRASYGENPDCPHCHPAYLKPGTCEPCIVKR